MKPLADSSFRPSSNLRNKLLGVVISVLIVVLGIVLGINLTYLLRSGEATAANTLSLVAERLSDNMQSWLVNQQHQTLLTADNPFVEQTATQIAEHGPDALNAQKALTSYLLAMGHNFPDYGEIYAVSPGGRVLFSTDPSHVRETRPVDDLIKQPLKQGGVYFQDAYRSFSTNTPSVAYSVAINSRDGQHVAVLVFRVGIGQLLGSISKNEYQLGNAGEILLLRSDRTIINQPRNEPGLQFSGRSNTEAAELAVQGEQGVLQGLDRDKRPVVAAYSYVPFARWGLVVEENRPELMEPVWRSTVLMTIPGLVGLLVLILLVSFFIRRTVAPLQEMVRVAIALNGGDFTQRIQTGDRHDNEIGVPGRAFNDMATGLQAQFTAQHRVRQLLEEVIPDLRLVPRLKTALATIARSHGMAFGAIYLRAEETDTLNLAATYCPSRQLSLEQEVPVGQGPGGQALSSLRPVVLENIPVDTVYAITTISGDLLPTCIFHMPLIFGGQAIGLMVLASISQPEADCLDQLQTASSLLAVTLHNSLMYQKVEELSEKLLRANEELSLTNEELQNQAEELRMQAGELHAKEQELIDTNQQLEQATQMKSDFLARMSHELRTPLNTVIGFCEILLEGLFGKLNDKQQEYVNDILSSGRDLLSLINDILDLSKIEAGREELFLNHIDPLTSLQEAVALTCLQAEWKQLQIDVRLLPNQYQVLADGEKLRQVFVNLLSNAIKFSPLSGKIVVSAKPDGERLAISIADQGIGIIPELHQVIFEKFKQGLPRPDSTQQGTGLGLAITKQLVEMHGGRIWVESSPGSGATFTFTIPMAAQDKQDDSGGRIGPGHGRCGAPGPVGAGRPGSPPTSFFVSD